jgi:putative aldouronate transport system permease protein
VKTKIVGQLGSFGTFKRRFVKSIPYYLLILLPFAYLVVFKYIPMYGIQIAFKDFSASRGFAASPWVGLKYFEMFLTAPSFFQIISNTLYISFYSLFMSFPLSILLAIALNECNKKKFVKTVQMVTYMPYFISTVVLVSMLIQFTDLRVGIINVLYSKLGGTPIGFMGKGPYFPHLYVWSGVWQTTGYSAVIYLAALSGVNAELYDAARVDGASKFKRVLHIDLPSIAPTIITLFILNIGSVLNVGFEKVYLMQNGINIRYSEVIATYVYKMGLQNMNYSFSTAVGLFNALVSLILLVVCNYIAKRVSDVTLW